jgi:hypothetical protein
MAAKKKKKASPKKGVLKLELIGGVFAVEQFPDGTERRTELPGEAVIQLVMGAMEQMLVGKEK